MFSSRSEIPVGKSRGNPLKILMATHYFGSHKGGIEIVAEELYRQLSESGQEVVWIAGNATPAPEAIGASRATELPILNFVELKIGLPFPIPTRKAFKQIRAAVHAADIVFLHDCLYLSNIATFWHARRRGVPVVIIQHIGFVPYKNPILNGLMRLANSMVTRHMLARADQVVFISETTKNFFCNLHFRGAPEVVFNGVNTDLYRPAESSEKKLALRRKYQLPERGPVMLFVGRFVEKKGLSILEQIVKQRPGYAWAFAGWGPLDPRGWNAQNVSVFSDLRGASMAELYRACDVFVLPSTGEGFPLVVQEALASGLPVLCSAEVAAADPSVAPLVRAVPIREGKETQTTEEFLVTLDELANSGEKMRETFANRRAFAVERYSWGKAADRYLEIAERLCHVVESTSLTMRADAGKASR